MSGFEQNSRRIIASLITLNRDAATRLLDILPVDEANAVAELLEHYQECTEPELRAKQDLNVLFAQQTFSGIAEVHPGWMLEALLRESPRVIGIILRYLPSRHVRYIMERLPREVKQFLPDMVQSFSVSPALLEVIRKNFEAQFVPMPFSRNKTDLSFDDIYVLQSEELELFMLDLGIHEMACALTSLSRQATHVLLNRFPLKIAKKIQERMKQVKLVSSALRHEARFTVLEAAGERVGTEQLLFDIGLSAFARSCGFEHENLLRCVLQKMPPQHGYVLKRALTQWSQHQPSSVLDERQQLLLDRLVNLARQGAVSGAWAAPFGHSVAASAS